MKKRFAALCLTCSALLSLSAPAAAVRAPNDSGQPQSSTGTTSVTLPSAGTLSFDQIGPRVKANNLTLKAAQESLKSAEAMDWDEAIDEMESDHIRLKILGELGPISPELRRLIERTDEISTHYQGFQANVCINYGGRDEILHAVRRYAEAYKAGTAPELTEDVFSGYLYSAGIPDPDLIIRTSGEQRLSNFLPWQGAYSELYFTDVLWPDFTERDMDAALAEFQRRDRRFGGVK